MRFVLLADLPKKVQALVDDLFALVIASGVEGPQKLVLPREGGRTEEGCRSTQVGISALRARRARSDRFEAGSAAAELCM